MSTISASDEVFARAGRSRRVTGGLVVAGLLALLVAGVSWAADGHKVLWSYHGQGTAPEFWGTLNHGECSIADTGREQSPINVDQSQTVTDAALGSLVFQYRANNPAAEPAEIINNGHTIQVNLPEGNTLEFGGKTWNLKQFHFHVPSEHTFDGEHASMEGHLVHKDADGNLLVVGVFFLATGTNSLINQVFHAAPEASHDAHAPGKQASFAVNPADMLPADQRYYTFQGSLTTPPCTEGVTWILLESGVDVDAGDVLHLWETFDGSTNRPTQPLYNRTVREGL